SPSFSSPPPPSSTLFPYTTLFRSLAGPGHLHRTARRRAHGWIVVRFVSSLRYEFRGVPMSWTVEGTYFENCNCDFACPCAVTSLDRKSTRLNSSHRTISYAVFCLK